MDFIDELRNRFSVFLSTIHADGHDDIISMPYAEYSLQCFVIYKDMLYNRILHSDCSLAQAFCAIGVNHPRDQLMIFIDTFYLFCQMQNKQLN